MKTISIDHPLRTISYKLRTDTFALNSETTVLEEYTQAHDQVWRMKLLFEKEKGEVQLILLNVHKLTETYREMKDTLQFYKEQIDFSNTPLHNSLDITFQVELRNFYNSVTRHHHRLVRFYDQIAALDTVYIAITDQYLRGTKPIDPLYFTTLDAIFENPDDMQVEISSLDRDLQQFLQTLTAVYHTLDLYTQQYNTLYKTYSDVLRQTAQLTKDAEILSTIWND